MFPVISSPFQPYPVIFQLFIIMSAIKSHFKPFQNIASYFQPCFAIERQLQQYLTILRYFQPYYSQCQLYIAMFIQSFIAFSQQCIAIFRHVQIFTTISSHVKPFSSHIQPFSEIFRTFLPFPVVESPFQKCRPCQVISSHFQPLFKAIFINFLKFQVIFSLLPAICRKL